MFIIITIERRFKMRKKIICVLMGILCVFSFTFFSTKDVSAASLMNARIVRVGVYPGITAYSNILLFIDDPNDIWWTGTRLFIMSPDLGNQGLAVALAAISSEKSVVVRIGATDEEPAGPGSMVTVMYLNAE
jgi:hypothetical protein